ncbi:zinc-binding oxidoreductase [Stagonosporopsis vannaccii]|nr:zinc-binding oxidoreductase [Stagonosporopsis vannaccii]
MSQNKAAWIGVASAQLIVKEAPRPKPGPGELVIKNAVVSVNPVDWKIQLHGRYLSTYPFILGEDAAGYVEEVGSGVTRHCHGLMTTNPANSAFQMYPIVLDALASPVPESITLDQAVVLPLALSTACSGLYPKNLLNLPLPSATKIEKNGKTVLIWGGSSSVGATAIQLAAASGVTVVTTASSTNHGLVKSLGAEYVFDYKSSTVIQDIANVLRNTEFAGIYDAISDESSFEKESAILDELKKKVPVASVLPGSKRTALFNPVYVVAFAIIQEPNKPIGEWIWQKFLPEALANGLFQPKPDPLPTGHGLEGIQNGLDVQRKGVSARKIVVPL